MKNVLVFGMTDTKGGMESCIMNYYNNINSECVHFDFLCNFDIMVYADEVEKNGSKVFYIPKRSDDLKAYKLAVDDFFKNHAHEYDAIWFNTCLLSNIDYLKYAKKYGINKRIIHAHNSMNMGSKLRGIVHEINKRHLVKYATDFWSCSNDASEYFYTENVRTKYGVKIINNAINLSKFEFDECVREKYRKEMNIPENAIVYGNVGRFHFQKNQDFLIDIFSEIQQKNKDTYLIMIGKGPDLNNIKEKISELKLKNILIFEERNDVNAMMQAMDVFIFPSKFEGLGMVLVEAQATGLISFASEKVIPDIVKMTDLVTFVSLEKNAEAWADEIRKIEPNFSRNGYLDKIKEAGYDIKSEALKVESLFAGNEKANV